MRLGLQGGSKQRNFRESIFVKKILSCHRSKSVTPDWKDNILSVTNHAQYVAFETNKEKRTLPLLLYAWRRPKDFIKYVLTQNLDCLRVYLNCIYGGLWLLGPHPTPLANFRRKCELDQHFRRKHELKPVVCETCGHAAKNPYELSNHTYRTHGDHDAYLAKRRQWKANGKLKRAALDRGEWRNTS